MVFGELWLVCVSVEKKKNFVVSFIGGVSVGLVFSVLL